MAVVETPTKQVCQMKVNVGMDASGNTKTATVSIGSLSYSNWDAQKALNVVAALTPCLSKTVAEILHVQTATLDEE